MYNKLFESGNRAQLEKLKAKSYKGNGWENIAIDFGMRRLFDEIGELWCYRKENNPPFTEKKLHEIIRNEAADIANFAHMIILKCDKILKKE